MYSPTLGRFITQDPTGFQAGDVNLYRFVGNSPNNLVDPTGLQAWTIKAQDLLYQDPRVSTGRGLNEKTGTVVATITASIVVDEAAKRYTLVMTITSAVPGGTNTATEWYLRDLYYSTKDGAPFRGLTFDKEYPFRTKLEGQFVPKPIQPGTIDFSKMQTEKDWPLNDEVLRSNLTC